MFADVQGGSEPFRDHAGGRILRRGLIIIGEKTSTGLRVDLPTERSRTLCRGLFLLLSGWGILGENFTTLHRSIELFYGFKT